MSTSASLLHLPDELLEAILLLLDDGDIVRCKRVSSPVKALVDQSMRLQYRIELAYEGLLPPTEPETSPEERLQHIRAIRSIWERPRPVLETRVQHVSFLGESQWKKDMARFCAGFFVGIRKNGDEHVFAVIDLNEPEEETPSWVLHIPHPFLIDGYNIDPSEDLLVLPKGDTSTAAHRVTLRLLTLRGGQPHPRAFAPLMGFRTYCPGRPEDFRVGKVHVSETRLAFQMSASLVGGDLWTSIFILDWVTGGSLAIRLQSTTSRLYDACILPQNFLLVAREDLTELDTIRFSIELYQLVFSPDATRTSELAGPLGHQVYMTAPQLRQVRMTPPPHSPSRSGRHHTDPSDGYVIISTKTDTRADDLIIPVREIIAACTHQALNPPFEDRMASVAVIYRMAPWPWPDIELFWNRAAISIGIFEYSRFPVKTPITHDFRAEVGAHVEGTKIDYGCVTTLKGWASETVPNAILGVVGERYLALLEVSSPIDSHIIAVHVIRVERGETVE